MMKISPALFEKYDRLLVNSDAHSGIKKLLWSGWDITCIFCKKYKHN